MTTESVGAAYADAALGAAVMDDVARYTAEGRVHQGAKIDVLNERFLSLYRKVLENSDPAEMKEFEDINAELSLRGEKPPQPSAEDKEYMVYKMRALGSILAANPDASDLLTENLAKKINLSSKS